MSARFPLRPRRPGIQMPLLVRRRANRLRNGARVVLVAASVFLAGFVLASVLFTPVFLFEVARMEVASGGGMMNVSQFTGHIEALFLGLLAFAVAIVGLFAGVLLARGTCRAARRLAESELSDVPSRCLLKGGLAEMCCV